MPASPLDRYRSDGVQALSPQRILVLLYQRLLTDLDRATAAIARDRPAEAHDALVHAQDIVIELRAALDPSAWPGATTLDELYQHLERLLVQANVAKSPELVDRCRQLVAPLAEAWEQAYRLVSAGRVDATGGVRA